MGRRRTTDGDGVDELVVVCTLHSVHVLRPDLASIAQKQASALALMQEIMDLEQQLADRHCTTCPLRISTLLRRHCDLSFSPFSAKNDAFGNDRGAPWRGPTEGGG